MSEPPDIPHHARRVLVDGRSGSGKTELAEALVGSWPSAQLVRLDDIYPGWDGLDEASAMVPTILSGQPFRHWDWATGRAGLWQKIDLARPIVVEGVGAISRASRPLADYTIWVELDDRSRKRRALERDGDAYTPFWERWARQEERFIARERPQLLADEIVTGAT